MAGVIPPLLCWHFKRFLTLPYSLSLLPLFVTTTVLLNFESAIRMPTLWRTEPLVGIWEESLWRKTRFSLWDFSCADKAESTTLCWTLKRKVLTQNFRLYWFQVPYTPWWKFKAGWQKCCSTFTLLILTIPTLTRQGNMTVFDISFQLPNLSILSTCSHGGNSAAVS